LRRKHALANTRSWRPLGKDQSRFVAAELRTAGEHWEIQGRCNKAGPSARRDLHRCAVAARREPDLVRDRRWFDSSHDRCRKNLDQRDASRHFGVAENFVDRSRTFRFEHRLRSSKHDADRRSAAPHFCYARWRQNVDGDHKGHTAGQIVNAVREDPDRKGLLFAGAETGVYVSFDDGANWESLRLNLPASSVRDLIIRNDDLIVATHGRGFWILDNITPLRELNRSQREDLLFKPQIAMRVRANLNTDTPLPPDEPAGENPPDGAMIDYFLSNDANSPITIEIKESKGQSVRKYSSADGLVSPNPKRLKIPSYWIRPLQWVSTKAGMHRFLWDMHYTPVPNVEPEFPISAIYRNTPPEATSPWAAPGDYTVTLTVNGKTFSQPLSVVMD